MRCFCVHSGPTASGTLPLPLIAAAWVRNSDHVFGGPEMPRSRRVRGLYQMRFARWMFTGTA